MKVKKRKDSFGLVNMISRKRNNKRLNTKIISDKWIKEVNQLILWIQAE